MSLQLQCGIEAPFSLRGDDMPGGFSLAFSTQNWKCPNTNSISAEFERRRREFQLRLRPKSTPTEPDFIMARNSEKAQVCPSTEPNVDDFVVDVVSLPRTTSG